MKKFLLRTSCLFLVWTLALHGQEVMGQTYAAQSVLAEGNWYKLGCVRTGVYKLDYNFFNNLGLTPSSINPQHIRIMGNGGGMLPQSNATSRHDDLVENAIEVVGEEDGSFDPGDYVLFYGEGPHVWNYDGEEGEFFHEYNLYADTNFYFLNVGTTPALRIETAERRTNVAQALEHSRGMQFYERDQQNILSHGSGRYWVGESFEGIPTREVALAVPDADPQSTISLRIRVAVRSNVSTQIRVGSGNTQIGTISLGTVNVFSTESTHHRYYEGTFSVNPSLVDGDSLRLTLNYERNGSNQARAWLDWVEVEYPQQLDIQGRETFSFTLADKVASGLVTQISLANGGTNYDVWEVTDPLKPTRYEVDIVGNELSIATLANKVRKFVAFRDANLTPISAQKVTNQNLHGLPLADYLIITHPRFRSAADKLANFHRNHYGRTVHIVYPSTIFNEFSSGRMDVSAIRDFIRMFYVQSEGTLPGFVLFLGDGTFDYKNHLNIEETTNFVPTYQSRNSWDPTDSYTSDDFFVFLDEDEGFWGEGTRLRGDNRKEVNLMDAAIGRLPVVSLEEANEVVDKIVEYATNPNFLGDWRNRVVLVADHKEEDGSLHVSQADSYSLDIRRSDPCIQVDKIYMDNYPLVPTASRPSFPEGRRALLDALDEGSLLVNYTGHGGEFAWSNASILLQSDIPNIQNQNRLPAVITATCEFGRFDDPGLRSAAEDMVLRPDGGAIALFTTVRLVYANPNRTLNKNLYQEIFTYDEEKGRMPTLGEVMLRTKNATFVRGDFPNINSRNFTLLGDPGLILNYPTMRAKITHINDQEIQSGIQDTLRSLSNISVRGIIEAPNGNVMDAYSGNLDVTVFDKPSKFTTRLSDFTFYWQTNRIFNGNASVNQGEFEFDFVVPIDISYDEGQGKIELYAYNEEIDASGCYSNFFIGGTDPNAEPDNEGPEIELFINDENWVSGGITSRDPYLLANVSDRSGINTVRTGIGHDIIGILDEDESNILILNDFYTALDNSSSAGTIRYQMRDLEPGLHTLKVRVWDGANNPSEATTEFIVSEGNGLVLDQPQVIPNPVTEDPEFWIRHNQEGTTFQVDVRIFDVAGRLVDQLNSEFMATGNLQRMPWSPALALGNGIYVYQVVLTNTETGESATQLSRLALQR